MRRYLLVAFALFVAHCNLADPVSVDGGRIEGRVKATGDYIVLSIEVPESHAKADPNDSGEFAFSGLLPGEFSVRIQANKSFRRILGGTTTSFDTTITGLHVRERETTQVPDILVPCLDTVVTYKAGSITVQNLAQEDLAVFGMGDTAKNISVRNLSDTIRISLEVEELLYSYPNYFPQATPARIPICVLHNGDTVFNAVPAKGVVQTPPIGIGDCDTFQVAAQENIMGKFILSKAKPYNRLRIQTGNVSLRKANNRSVEFFTIGQDTFSATYPGIETVDWDVALVNLQTGDTCQWKNPKVAGMAPYSDLYYRLGRPAGQGYQPDTVLSNHLAPGFYSVIVTFYEGAVDSAMPKLNIELGKFYSQIMNFVQLSPASYMTKGQTWNAAILQIPEMQVRSADTIARNPAKVAVGSEASMESR